MDPNAAGGLNGAQAKSTQFGKLFVGQVPAVCTEDMLLPLFQPYGTIIEVKVMRDGSGRSKGCAWVRYETQQMAQAAIDSLHEKHTIPPQTNTLQVRYAHSTASGPQGSAPQARRPRQPRSDQMREQNAPMYEQQQQPTAYFPAQTTQPGQLQQNNPYSMAWTGPPNQSFGSFASAGQTNTSNSAPQVNTYPSVQWPAYHAAQRMPMSPPGLSVFLGNLPPSLTNEELAKLIHSRLPHVSLVALNIHRDRRFGFATFENPQAASDACRTLDGLDVHERKIRAEITQNEPKQQHLAHARPSRPPHTGGPTIPMQQHHQQEVRPPYQQAYAQPFQYPSQPQGVAVPAAFAYDHGQPMYHEVSAQAVPAWSGR